MSKKSVFNKKNDILAINIVTMKISKIFILLLAFSLMSCRNELVDLEDGLRSNANYFPLDLGNYWTYNVKRLTVSNKDSLFVQKDTTINGNAYKKFKTKLLPNGFYSTALNNNSVRQSNDRLLLAGKFKLEVIANNPTFIDLSDFVIFKELTSANEVIGTKTGTIEQVFGGRNVKVEYTLQTIGLPPLSAFMTPDGKTYANVKPIRMIVNVKIEDAPQTLIGQLIVIPILLPQDVIISTQYYAKNKGMVYAKTDLSYQLQNLPQIVSTGVAMTRNETQEEFLDKSVVK